MASPYYTSPGSPKKRPPPPLNIPPTESLMQGSFKPGPNAFAIKEAKAEEERKRVEAARQQVECHLLTRDDMPQAFDDDDVAPDFARAGSSEFRLSSKEAYSNLAEGVLKSPKKSAHSRPSSLASRQDRTSRSRQSGRDYRHIIATQRQLEGLGEEATDRAVIEARQEGKNRKALGLMPETPKAGTHFTVQDLRPANSTSKKMESEETLVKSPSKKKFMDKLKYFTSKSAHSLATTPQMPFKAGKVLGVTPSTQPRKISPPANTLANLKLSNQPGDHHHRRRSPTTIYDDPSPSRTRRRSPPERQSMFVHEQTLAALTSSPVEPHTLRAIAGPEDAEVLADPEEVEYPPIPPRKDSLPNVRQQVMAGVPKPTVTQRTVSQLLQPPPSPEATPEDFEDSGMQLLVPLAPHIAPIPTEGGESPTKYCPPVTTADKPVFVEGPSIFSSYGIMKETIEEEGEPSSNSAPLMSPTKSPFADMRGDRRSAPASPSARTTLWVASKDHWASSRSKTPKAEIAAAKNYRWPELEYLPAKAYRPPPTKFTVCETTQTDNNTGDRTAETPTPSPRRGSIPIVFQGDESEITIATSEARPGDLKTRVLQDLRIQLPKGPGIGSLQPLPSSSQLTDILNGVSPSKANFHDMNGSSAAPSPLRSSPRPTQTGLSLPAQNGPHTQHGPNAQNGPAVQTGPHSANVPASHHPRLPPVNVPASGSIHDHFYMTNEHIDVSALSIFDWVTGRNNDTMATISTKHEQLRAVMENQFDDLKSQISSVGDKADHNGNQSHNINIQLQNLRDFIKAELVEPLAAQTKKMNAMEQGMKEMQKAVQELQKTQSQPSSICSPQAPYYQLPNLRSQPALTQAFYDGNHFAAQTPQVPSGASALGRFGGNTQLGRSTFGRENRENAQPYPNTGNPYHSPSGSFNTGYGTGGGYNQPSDNYSQHNQQAFGFNQALQKNPFGQP